MTALPSDSKKRKLFGWFQVGLFSVAACSGTVTIEWGGPVGELGCDFDAGEVCAVCDNETIYICDCTHPVDGQWYAYDEMMPCVSGRCGLVCGGQAIFVEISGQCIADGEQVPTEGGYNCNDWEPDDLIANSSTNTYDISGQLISALEYDVTPLYECDSARVNVSDGLVVEYAVSTDMVYLLGLRNGDKLVEVNGMPLGDPMEAFMAYAELWLNQGEDSYTLKVQRGTGFVYLNYYLIFTTP